MHAPEESSADHKAAEELLAALLGERWWPLEPLSDDCHSAVAFPELLLALEPRDQDGLYLVFVHSRLAERFLKGHEFAEWKGRVNLKHVACLFLLRHRYGHEHIDRGLFDAHWSDFCGWFVDRLRPAVHRWSDASREERERDPTAFEPALTGGRLFRGILGRPNDLLALSFGLAMHEHNRLRPPGPTKLLSEEEHVRWLALCAETNPRLVVIRKGRLTIDAKGVKTALDGLLGRSKTRREVEVSEDELTEPESPDSAEAIEAVAAADALAAVRKAVQHRRSLAPAGSARAHVLDHFEELERRELKYADLGSEVGMAAATLHEAYRLEREAVLARLHVA